MSILPEKCLLDKEVIKFSISSGLAPDLGIIFEVILALWDWGNLATFAGCWKFNKFLLKNFVGWDIPLATHLSILVLMQITIRILEFCLSRCQQCPSRGLHS